MTEEKINLCTLFNVNYLNRGLLMYTSLKAEAKNFDLYVICFDNVTYEILKKLNHDNLIPVSLKEFEDEELLKIKPSRTAAEYCWTCSSSSVLYCIEHFKLDNCTYVDADLYFYSDPAKIWKEDPSASVLITLHNYSAEYDQSNESGRFCVQFTGFKNNAEGMKALKDWRNDCIKWCFNRIEDGKFGDQKYLDEWPQKYKGVHIVKDITAGLAPWNIDQFKIVKENLVVQKSDSKKMESVFFHFHGLKIFKDQMVSFTSHRYHLNKTAQTKIYLPYAKRLLEIDNFLRKSFPGIYNVVHEKSGVELVSTKEWLRFYLYDVKNDLKNIDANLTKSRFKNNYTFKIEI